jgi:hypothetical protein
VEQRVSNTHAETCSYLFLSVSCILLMSMDQPSSIPVDRHVYQFAERWYRIKTKGGLKGYETIAEKFRDLWGPYAGWAHSVLFTADLRAFATYKTEKQELQLGSTKIEIKEEVNLINDQDTIVKQEETEPVYHDNGRPARNKPKREREEYSSPLTEAFPGIKRTASQQRKIVKQERP